MAGELGRASFQAVFEDQGVVKGLKGIDSQANNTVSKAGGAFSSLGDIAKTALGVVSVGAIAAVGTSLVNMSMDFEVSMAKINTLLGDDTNLKQYEQTIIDFSKKTGLSIENLSDGMYQTISSIGDLGDETEQIFQTMGTSAKAGGAEMSDAVALISSAMKGYGEVNDDTARKISDLAFTTAKLGVTTFPELAKSMQPLFPLGDSLNFSYEELFGTMATLTGVTGNTAEVTTQMKAVMSGLISPTKQMGALISKYGYANGQAMIETEGLAGFLQILQDETGGQSDKMAELFGSTEALTAITALSGSQFDTFKEKLGEMENASGATETAYDKMSNTLRDKLDVTMNNLKVTAMNLSTTLLGQMTPAITAVLDTFNALLNGEMSPTQFFEQFTTGAQSLITQAPAMIQTGFDFVNNLVTGFVNSLPMVIENLTGVVSTMITFFYTNMPTFIQSGYDIVLNLVNGLLASVPNLLESMGTLFQTLFTNIEANLPTFLENGKNFVFNLIDGVIANLPTIIDGAVTMFQTFLTTLITNLPSIVKTGMTFISELVAGIVARIPDLVANGVMLIGKLVTTLIANLPQIFSAGTEILFSVVDGIGSVLGSMADIGKNIVEGIWDGIKGMGSWLKDKVVSFASDNLPGPIKKFLGIHSPSRLFCDEVGKMIPQGLAIGIEADADKATSAMDDLSASLIAEPVKISSPETLKSLYGTNSDNVSRETQQQQTAVRPIVLQIGNKEFARAVVDVTTEQDRINLLMGV